MQNIAHLFKLLQRFIRYTQEHPQIGALIIGGYKATPASILLAEDLGSALNSTTRLIKHPDFGGLVSTEFFVKDAQKIVTQPALLADFIQLWEPIVNRLLKKSGTSIEALRQLPMTAAQHYQTVEEPILSYWIYYLSTIQRALSSFLKETKESILLQFQHETHQLQQEKQQLQEAHNRILLENQHYQTHGVIASNQYTLSKASPDEFENVVRHYQFKPVPGYDVATVEVISNPALEQHYALCVKILQARKNVPVFSPQWSHEHEDTHKKAWRKAVHQFLIELTQPFIDPQFPDVKQIVLFHGTSESASKIIAETGFAPLGTTDTGFFGKGIYGTGDAEYAHHVYAERHAPNGILMVNKMAFFSAYPTIEGEFFDGEANYANYDAHFALVSPRDPHNPSEVNYDPTSLNTLHTYVELVLFNNACLPCYRVKLQPSLPSTIKRTRAQQAYYVAEQCELAQQPLVAYYYFMQAKKQGEPKADNKINQLLHLHPEYRETFKIS